MSDDYGYDDERPPEPTRNYPLEAGIIALRVVQAVLVAFAVIVILGIILVASDANPDKGFVEKALDLADDVVGPFKDTFTPKEAEDRIYANYGLAFGIYLIAAFLVGFGIDALVKLRPKKARPAAGA